MSYLDLNTVTPLELRQQLTQHATLIACLCAAWCDVCSAYKTKFEALAKQHPDLLFLWIDIEDQAEIVGDIEIDNFPTLLIQQQGIITFYGTMQADTNQLKRLINADYGEQNVSWQAAIDLVKRLQE